jgi:predicted XRE-type DNA-binding protein
VKKNYRKLLDEGWEAGGYNTFADLGLPHAEKLQAKAYLRAAILARISALSITQVEAARRLGVPQPKLSNLMTDAVPRGFSSDKLMEFATKLGLDVYIHVKPARGEHGKVTITRAQRGRSRKAA